MAHVTGNIGRELAAVPLPAHTMSDQVKAAMVESSKQSAKAASRIAGGENPFAILLGEPTFEVGERKWYDDKGWGNRPPDPNKANMRIARATYHPVPNGPTIEFSIYVDRTLFKDAEGIKAREETRCSLPKGLTVDRKDTLAVLARDTFCASVIEQYEQWAATVDASAPETPASTKPGRLVKVIKVDDPTLYHPPTASA